ncbi:hypothetical protein B0H15DRAFT_351264 [Mycena belliarum]|uniref:Uncharacterized protein n=1 Tax=Mycena belliarum TaxID=1033014 RepID=A0AAD6U1C3_9AGAR|nr:hypothetical protein B0H15DRAFT_351264 [Mycena belliae]
MTAPDTVYGAHSTQTRLVSDTADNLLWDRFALPSSAHARRRGRALPGYVCEAGGGGAAAQDRGAGRARVGEAGGGEEPHGAAGSLAPDGGGTAQHLRPSGHTAKAHQLARLCNA